MNLLLAVAVGALAALALIGPALALTLLMFWIDGLFADDRHPPQ